MALLPPMTRLLFIASFKPQFRDKVTAMYDLYLRTHKMPSVGKLTAKAVSVGAIPWVAIPAVMAAVLRRGMYGSPEQIWGSTKVIGGTALAAAALRAAYDAPGTYKLKKQSVPRDYAAAAQDHILTQLLKNASQATPETPTLPAPQQASATAVLNPVVQPRQNTWSALLWVVSPQNVQTIMAGAAKQNQAPVQSAPVLPKPQQQQQATTPPASAPNTPTLEQDLTNLYNTHGRNFLYNAMAPGAQGDRNRMYTFGGLALLLAALSGQSFGSALLMGGLGLGLGAMINRYMLPRIGGKEWGQAQQFVNGIKDPQLQSRMSTAIGRAIFDHTARKFNGNTNYGSYGLAVKDYAARLMSKGAPGSTMGYDSNAGFVLNMKSGTTVLMQDLLAQRVSGEQRPQQQSGSTTQVIIGKNTTQRPKLRTAGG